MSTSCQSKALLFVDLFLYPTEELASLGLLLCRSFISWVDVPPQVAIVMAYRLDGFISRNHCLTAPGIRGPSGGLAGLVSS